MQTTVAITQYVWLSFGKSNLLGTFIIVNIFLSISSFYFFRCHCRGGPVLLWQWLYFLTFSISSSQIVAKSSQFTNFVCTKCLTAVTRENNNMFGNWMRNLVLKVNRLGCIAGTCPASFSWCMVLAASFNLPRVQIGAWQALHRLGQDSMIIISLVPSPHHLL